MMANRHTSKPLLVAENVSKRFGGVAALAGCTVALQPGSITGLIGPNGAGKTTLLNVIAGLTRLDSGHLVFDGKDITGTAPPDLARLGLTRTFQIARELGKLSVLENVMLARIDQSGERVFDALFRPGRVRREECEAALLARDILQRVNLWRLADAPASQLSGGQKKLLELARALMMKPQLILLDEPAAGVAPPLVAELMTCVRELAADGITFGIVEHNMHLIGALCDHVYVLAEGRTLAAGAFEDVTSDPRVIDAYLGEAA
jgi:ABC-type branched-subunit amino acid transport system ATPase component